MGSGRGAPTSSSGRGAPRRGARTSRPPRAPSPGRSVVNNKIRDRRSLEELYRDAQEILDDPRMSTEKYRELVTIKKRVEELLPPVSRHVSDREAVPVPHGAPPYVPYPSVLDPRFQRIISRKKEFAQGAYPPIDASRGVEALWEDRCRKHGFLLSRNQQVLRNFVSPSTPYNGLLLFHGVGVGKTCAAITIAEQFPEKRVIVLVQPGQNQYFQNQVFDFGKLRMTDSGVLDVMHASEQCTGTHYLSAIPDSELGDKQSVEHRIRRAIRARYSFLSTHAFAKQVHRLMDLPDWEQQIRRRYSDHVIVVDEAHHLRLTSTKDLDSRKITMALRNVVKFTEGVKLLLLTATPMFNESSDVMELVNLLLLNDKRKPLRERDVFDKKSGNNLTPEGARLLTDAIRGYVSYMRGEDPFAFPARLTPLDNGDPIAMPPGHPDQPTKNIKGERIPTEEKFRHTILSCSDLSASQRRVYTFTDDVLKEIAEEEDEGVESRHGLTLSGEEEEEGAEEEGAQEEGEGEDREQEGERGNERGDERGDGRDRRDGRDESLLRRSSYASAMRWMAMELCNIVYPVHDSLVRAVSSSSTAAKKSSALETLAKLSHGKTGFNNAFVRLPGPALRVKYAGPHVPRFLAPSLIVDHAPKLKTVIDRILNSEGIVFVYSQFLTSGLIPLAIALEHEGFTRYGQSNILAGDGSSTSGGGSVRTTGRAAGKGWTYVALSGQQDFSTQYEREIAASRDPANLDGDVVKVILASSKASEGMDLRNVREVHIIDPWFHFNKTEQIVGRAARNCSHAALPLEKRNVTVYLHAARFPRKHTKTDGDRETIDIRAYRIAENKHRRVREVEEVLVAHSIDCALNRHAQYYDPRELRASVDIRTSQGKTIRNYPLGDSPPRRRIACALDHDGFQERYGKPGRTEYVDESTYNAAKHVGGIQACKSVFMRMFRRGIAFTIDDVRRACHKAYPDANDEAILIAVEEALEERVIVKNARGKDGYIIYAGDKYVFQDLDAFDERVGMEDRIDDAEASSTLSNKVPDVFIFRDKSFTVTRHTASANGSKEGEDEGKGESGPRVSHGEEKSGESRMRQRQDSRSKEDDAGVPTLAAPDKTALRFKGMSVALIVSESAEAFLREKQSIGLLPVPSGHGVVASPNRSSISSSFAGKLYEAAVDFTVDRLDRRMLFRLVQEIAVSSSVPPNRGQRGGQRGGASSIDRVRESLERGYVITRHSSEGGTIFMYDYYAGKHYCFDVSTGKASECFGVALQRAIDEDRGAKTAALTDHRRLKGYVLHSTGSEKKGLRGGNFKLMGSSMGSSGCVCSQTSNIKVGDMERLIRDVKAPHKPNEGSDIAALKSAVTSLKTRKFDKKNMCVLYELMLRLVDPGSFARPSVASRVFRQKGKRLLLAKEPQ